MSHAERLLIEADPDAGIAVRVLDLLIAVDRAPCSMRLEQADGLLTFSVTLAPSPSRVPLAARIRQILGVRRVLASEVAP